MKHCVTLGKTPVALAAGCIFRTVLTLSHLPEQKEASQNQAEADGGTTDWYVEWGSLGTDKGQLLAIHEATTSSTDSATTSRAVSHQVEEGDPKVTSLIW